MKLTLILGCMFAGKSSELIRYFRRYSVLGKKILVVNHVWNTRHGHDSAAVSTHDSSVLEHDSVLTTEKLEDVFAWPDFASFDVVFIEELQFFNFTGSDVLRCVVDMVEVHGKIVVASGLDGSAEREPMGDVLKLIPYADEKIFVSALCRRCGDGTPAVFSSRKVVADSVVSVGGADKYEALCRRHFLQQKSS